MSIDATKTFNLSVKKVEFFPYEWNENLLAVCLPNEVKIFSYNSPQYDLKPEQMSDEELLQHIMTIPFQSRIDHFCWSPCTNLRLKPIIKFAVCDNNGNLIFCTAEFSKESLRNLDTDLSSFVKMTETKINADIIYKISYDYQDGKLMAFNADNSCYLWDCEAAELKCQFTLQSSGVGICWHRDEKNKLMVAERSGLIRIYNLETLKPIYTLMSMDPINNHENLSLLSFDWCQTNPEIVIATTRSDIIFWNTSNSCLPEKITDKLTNLKTSKISKFNEDLIGYSSGTDTCSKLTLLNYHSNQIVYQTKDMKLLNSFSFNATLPLIAIANEKKLTIMNLINQS